MNNTNELAKTEEPGTAIAVTTPMDLLQIATEQGADIEKLEKLMALQERWEANEARKAYVVAMNAFKADPPTLIKDKHVGYGTGDKRTEYDHASLDQVSKTIAAALSKHGISHRWDVEQPDGGAVKVTCVLTHELGHSESVPMQSGRDTSGGKNDIQALGSTITYLQRYTLLAATGMAVQGMDNDGDIEDLAIPQKQVIELLAIADKAGANADGVSYAVSICNHFKIDALTELPTSQFQTCKEMLESKLPKKGAT